ncbi:MAG: methylmalonyl-CoA mutase [Chloroflexi bacterium]|nr:methylmalonyl-CoA mutase [Chloroflexota bacterium]
METKVTSATGKDGRDTDAAVEAIAQAHEEWRRAVLQASLQRFSRRKPGFATLSGIPINDLYTPADLGHQDFARDIGFPGQYPYTRGVHATMYRSRLWTIRQVAGFGSAEDTNQRYKYLLAHGETGLSTDFDLPTLLGRDSDHLLAMAEVGKIGVAIDTLRDAHILWDGIPLGEVSTSMTITSPAFVLTAMYEATAAAQGVSADRVTGTAQADILKEYTAQNEYIYPPEPSVRLVVDLMEYCARRLPRFNPVSVSGYHIREAGATAAQELAFTLADGYTYAKAAVDRGLDVDALPPRISFFFDVHIDFFEEIAKLRAARRIWARMMREKLGARDPRSWMLRMHCQTAGVSLTAQQVENNIVRTTVEALAAVLGGTQSLHTNSMDEAFQIPSEKAIKIAVRTQQILAHETGAADVVDPLAGSYYVESLTNRIEEEAWSLMNEIERRGGMVACIEAGFIQKQIANSAADFQRAVEAGEQTIVGMNAYVEEESGELSDDLFFQVDPATTERQIARLRQVRAERRGADVSRALSELKQAAKNGRNIMPSVTDAVTAYATIGEICDVLREVFGEYKALSIF